MCSCQTEQYWPGWQRESIHDQYGRKSSRPCKPQWLDIVKASASALLDIVSHLLELAMRLTQINFPGDPHDAPDLSRHHDCTSLTIVRRQHVWAAAIAKRRPRGSTLYPSPPGRAVPHRTPLGLRQSHHAGSPSTNPDHDSIWSAIHVFRIATRMLLLAPKPCIAAST